MNPEAGLTMDVFDLPPEHPMRHAHAQSIHHRRMIEKSTLCGCFCCHATFSPDAITRWTDTAETEDRHTALCPVCGIDSVIGDATGLDISPAFLAEMNLWWFGGPQET